MASTAYRKVSPSMCIAGSHENRPQSRAGLIPRSSSKSLTSVGNGLKQNTSLPNLHNGRVRFADSVPIPIRAPNLQLKVVTPLADSTPLEPKPLALASRLKHLTLPSNTSSTVLESSSDMIQAAPITNEIPVNSSPNPFADSNTTAIELSELCIACKDNNPFNDGSENSESDSSTSSSSPSTLIDNTNPQTPDVMVVDGNSETNTPFEDGGIDHKELRTYSIALETLYHPNIARQQYREMKGSLYTMGIRILSGRSLCPLDLEE